MKPSAAIAHLRDYVALPSVNPMGRSDIPAEIAGEGRYAQHLREQLRAMGLDCELVGPADRPSVLAEVRAEGTRETVLVASHIDTVPIDGMEIAPFDPELREGRVYGRGSCDTKAGMAALVAALERVLPGRALTRNLILVGESDEEFGSIGAEAIADRVSGHPPDWAIATEPTDLRVVSAHKGIAITRLRASGRACHSSAPREGRSAIVALARAVLALDALGAELAGHEHPRLGCPTLSVGRIGGGHAPNIVPDEAWLIMDRRLLPGESAETVREQIGAVFAREGVTDVEIESCRVMKSALDTPHDGPAVQRCLAALSAIGQGSEPTVAAFGTDAGVLADRGIPSVVLGPGSIAEAHTSRESVPIDQVEAMTEFFVQLLTS